MTCSLGSDAGTVERTVHGIACGVKHGMDYGIGCGIIRHRMNSTPGITNPLEAGSRTKRLSNAASHVSYKPDAERGKVLVVGMSERVHRLADW
ncbi:MAG: hypothetical protein M1546_23675 [Chloroflexi bacterium]|nr:hypothetical protein [Chloroflexota bacterium]